MPDPKPPITAELIWTGELQFGVTTGRNALILDGNSTAGPSPMQLLAVAIAGCMAADVVSIVEKGRHPLKGLRASVTCERLPEPPRRLTRVTLHFHITGAVPREAAQRAVDLSRDKYCSAWNSIRADVPLHTQVDIVP